jgi:hypothetical protein
MRVMTPMNISQPGGSLKYLAVPAAWLKNALSVSTASMKV